ncbi:complex I subunit 5 family protein [Ancylobacter sp. VNQ12]|uniref:complex I subunit 5 family protein n=1 Tax=Ancylobacter sp. VNQ12 TaxID=3400920 RepID=UPI003C11E4D2
MNAPFGGTLTGGGLLLAATLFLPLLLAGAALKPVIRRRALDLLPVAPLPGLLAALLAPGERLLVAPDPMRMVLALDTPGTVLLGGASLLWLGAGLYARTYMREDPRAGSFAIWWLLTLAGSLGVFIVADVASFYLVFALASLPAFGLVAHEKTRRAERAGFWYMALAMLAEAVLLLGFVLIAMGGEGNPLIRDAVARLAASPHAGLTVTLLVIGFGLKMGLVPLHVWMPLAHPVAPMPASAVLSGVIVKAGVIGLIRFLPLEVGLPGAGTVLVALGLVTAFYAVLVGITQTHPKTVLAYSTVSQMGVVAALIGAGLASAAPLTGAVAAFYALHHMLVKGALFLGVGIVAAEGRRMRSVMMVMAVLALSLAGLPFTSGMLAKYAAKELMGDGTVALLATLSAAGSALLMLHFLRLLPRIAEAKAGETPPAGLVLRLTLPWAGIALASLALPWALFAPVTGLSPATMLGAAALWKATWPLLLGGLLFLVLRRWGNRLPIIPEGDVVVVLEAARPAIARLGAAVERTDGVLRQWPVAVGLLAVIVLLLATALPG